MTPIRPVGAAAARERTAIVQPVAQPEPGGVDAVAPGKLDALLAQIHGRFGRHTVTLGSQLRPATHLPTGIFTLDLALLGGFPESSISMLIGWESSSKSTIALRTLAEAQRRYPERTAALVDIEGSYAPAWGAAHGIDNARLLLLRPDHGEAACDIIDALLRTPEVSLVVLDSLPAMVATKEAEGSFEDANVALQARLIGRHARQANSLINARRLTGCPVTLLWINQWRSKITMMGDNRAIPGGNAVRFFSSCIVEVTKRKEQPGKDDKDIETIELNEHAFSVRKSKVGISIKTGEFQMIRSPANPLGQGWIDDAKTVVSFAKKFGLISGSGGAYRLEGCSDGFRKFDDVAARFNQDPILFGRIKALLIQLQRRSVGLPANYV